MKQTITLISKFKSKESMCNQERTRRNIPLKVGSHILNKVKVYSLSSFVR